MRQVENHNLWEELIHSYTSNGHSPLDPGTSQFPIPETGPAEPNAHAQPLAQSDTIGTGVNIQAITADKPDQRLATRGSELNGQTGRRGH